MPQTVLLPLTLHPSKRKMLVSLVTSLILVLCGLISLNKEPFVAWGGIVFFGTCAVAFAVCLHPGASYLQISAQGFTFSSLFRRAFVPWSAVTEFRPIRIGLNEMVGWDFAPSYQPQRRLRAVNSAITGAEGALPDTYGIPAARLADLLNDICREYR